MKIFQILDKRIAVSFVTEWSKPIWRFFYKNLQIPMGGDLKYFNYLPGRICTYCHRPHMLRSSIMKEIVTFLRGYQPRFETIIWHLFCINPFHANSAFPLPAVRKPQSTP